MVRVKESRSCALGTLKLETVVALCPSSAPDEFYILSK